MDLYGLLQVLIRELAVRLGGAVREEEAEDVREAHALAIADIVALAALADGQVSSEELRALEATRIGEGELAVAAVERLYRLECAAEDLASSEWLAVKISDLALPLDARERRDALRHVIALAGHGARLAVRGGDRDAPREPQTLVALFARGLGIPEDEIAGLSARPAERA